MAPTVPEEHFSLRLKGCLNLEARLEVPPFKKEKEMILRQYGM